MAKIVVRCALLLGIVILFLFTLAPSAYADGGEAGGSFEVVTYQITDLSASSPTENSIDLTWTTPEAGTHAFSYFDLRYSKATITLDNWDEATRVGGELTPIAGTSQGRKVKDLERSTTYYFAIKLVDEEGLVGLLSNIASAATLAAPLIDTTAPACITDLTATPGSPAATEVVLSWTAPGDDGDTGIATSYEIRRSTSAITDTNWSSATTIYNNITPQSAGGSESFVVSRLAPNTTYYFAVRANDEAGNTSPTSNSPPITTAAILPTITDISPTSGDNSQTRTLTIDGTNFVAGGINVVRFVSDDNTFDLTNVTCNSTTQLMAGVPRGAPTGTYKVRVINNNGTSELSSATYEVTEVPTPLPVVTNLIPQMVASNTTVSGVQIFGENLVNATAVSFGDTAAASFTVISDTKIIADAPGLTAGEYDVKVTTSGGTNEVSAVKFVVSEPVVIKEDTTKDTTTSEMVKLDTNVVPVQLTLTTDKAETATKATDVDADIEVVIPPQTTVTCEGEAYTGNINPPRVVKPDESVLTDLADDAVVVEMGNPEKTIDFDQELVVTLTITAPFEPVIWYYNKATHAYELAGKAGTKDGIDYVPGGTKLAQEDSTYTMGLLLDHMSNYVAGVKPHITSAPATATAGHNITVTGTNFHPTAVKVYFNSTAGTIVSRSYTQIVASFATAGSYTLKVENPDKLSDTTSIVLVAPEVGDGVAPPPPTYIETKLFGTEESFRISSTGKILETIEATSGDGMLTITIPRGTIALDKDGKRLKNLQMTVDESPPLLPEGAYIIGLAYNFEPERATFDPLITLTWSYDPDALPEGVAEVDLILAYYDEDAGKWVELDGVVDTENNTITASVKHFTTFAIIGAIPPPPLPATFSVGSLSILPSIVDVGETVTVSVLVANTGGKSGSRKVTLKINGVVEATKEVTVNAGFSKEVTFSISKDIAGAYSVEVDGLTGSFTVKKELVPVVPSAFTVSDLTVSPSEVYVGERVSISVLVANTGNESGSCKVTLKINGVVEAAKEVALAPGASESITFTTSKDVAGTYLVDVDGLTGSFTVKEKGVPFIKPVNWPLIGGIVGGIAIAVGLLVYFLVIRRRRTQGETVN